MSDEETMDRDDALKDVDIKSGDETPAPQDGMDDPEGGDEGDVGDGTGEGDAGPASG